MFFKGRVTLRDQGEMLSLVCCEGGRVMRKSIRALERNLGKKKLKTACKKLARGERMN